MLLEKWSKVTETVPCRAYRSGDEGLWNRLIKFGKLKKVICKCGAGLQGAALFCGLTTRGKREGKSINFPEGKLTWIWIEEATEISEADLEILDAGFGASFPIQIFYQITMTLTQ